MITICPINPLEFYFTPIQELYNAGINSVYILLYLVCKKRRLEIFRIVIIFIKIIKRLFR